MEEPPNAEEMMVSEAGAQEIPYPTAQVVNKKATIAGPIARARIGATPSLGAYATTTLTMPCYFNISRPWRRADAGVKINAEHPEHSRLPADQREESKNWYISSHR